AASLALDLIEQEVREPEPREAAAVVEAAEQPVVAGEEAALDVAHQLAAELERVAALHPGELLVQLVRLVERVRVGRRVSDVVEPAAQRDRAEPGDRLPAGDPESRVGVADAG